MARGNNARSRRNARRARLSKGAKRAPDEKPTLALVASTDPPDAAARALAEVGPDADPAILAIKTAMWEEKLAAMPACANCDHAYAEHLGSEGPCTYEGCSCNGYAAAEAEAAAAPAAPYTVNAAPYTMNVAIKPDLSGFESDVEGAIVSALEKVVARFTLTDFTVATTLADNSADSDVLPAEHKPGERKPPMRRGPGVPVAPPAGSAGVQWSAIFAPEGKLTSDGRAFAPGSITWRELPLTLMAMTETSEGGHIGAEVAGRIDKIWRDEAAGLIRAQGVFADTDYGALIACAALETTPEELGLTASLVGNETLRGVSVDLAISKYETGPMSDWFDESGNWAPKAEAELEPTGPLDLYRDDIIAVILDAEIGMTTVCPFPAFSEAKIAMGESLVAGANPAFVTCTLDAGWTAELVREPLVAPLGASEPAGGETVVPCTDCGGEALTASAAGLVPVAPPADWFLFETPEEPYGITVDDNGRVSGYAWLWDVCHIGLPGQCRTAPHSQADYAYFHLGEVVCDDGARVDCGQITLDAPHAGRELDSHAAAAHYDHTGTVVAHVRVGEDEHGGWVAGALQSDAPAEKVRLLRGSKLSGDWRKIDGNLELVALLAVNVPGFPVPRARALVASIDGGEPEVVSLVAAGIPVFESEIDPDERERFAALKQHARFAALALEAS